MKTILKLLIFHITLSVLVVAYDPITERPIPLNPFVTMKAANISPEIINELKDFENLIPTATIDEIVAKHYLVDGNFRTALKYLRSNEFTQLQRQLLTIPEIINVLEFLHLTTVNATTMHMGATTITADKTEAIAAASLDDYNDNRIDKMTTNIATNTADAAATTSPTTTTTTTSATTTEGASLETVYKRPQYQMKTNGNNNNEVDVNNADAGPFMEEHPLVRIVLLEYTKIKMKAYDVVPVNAHNDKHISTSSSYTPHRHHHHHHGNGSLGTFTTFVEEILQHLPNSAYQNMINDKCKKNAKFAEFYKALRSPEFKPIVDEAMKTPNIVNIIKTLSSHDVDVKSLEPVAFQVISWGPKV